MNAPGRPAEDQITRMVGRIAERFRPDKIVLFGSNAHGTAGPDSDVDLLVIMPVRGSRRDQAVAIGVAVHDIPLSKDIVVATPEDVARRGDLPGTILRPALREGRVVYVGG